MLKEETVEMAKELRQLLQQIKGVQGFTETFSLSYVLAVDSEESKVKVQDVANVLTEQAVKNHGIDLEIIAVTQEEMQEAADKFREYQMEKSSFVS